jgi:hypothetical protein
MHYQLFCIYPILISCHITNHTIFDILMAYCLNLSKVNVVYKELHRNVEGDIFCPPAFRIGVYLPYLNIVEIGKIFLRDVEARLLILIAMFSIDSISSFYTNTVTSYIFISAIPKESSVIYLLTSHNHQLITLHTCTDPYVKVYH